MIFHFIIFHFSFYNLNLLMTFELQHTDPYSDARAGIITTDHGQIKTPIFMPVGTVGSVKGVHFSELR